MTPHELSPDLAQKIDTLEALAAERLQQPDGVVQIVGYNFHLSDHYSVQVESRTRSGTANIYDDPDYANAQETALFINRRDRTSDHPHQWAGLAFSAVHRDPADEIGGFQYDPPEALTREVYALSRKQGDLYITTLGICRYLDSLNYNDKKYSKKPVLAADSEDDEAMDEYFEWGRAHNYDLEQATAGHPPFGPFLLSAYRLLADGAIYRQLRHGNTEDAGVYVSETTISGSLEHVDFRHANDPQLLVEVQDGEIEYEYERSRTGNVEIKTHSSKYLDRYKGLKSFEWIVDEDEDEEIPEEERAFNHDENELLAVQAEERALGLYVPTGKTLDLIIDKLKSA